MIQLSKGWAQWDSQIGTYRAEIDGTLYGKFSGDVDDPRKLPGVTEDQALDLEAERASFPVDPGAPSSPSLISKNAFIDRFTADETKRILLLAKTDPDIEMFVFRLDNAAEVDLKDEAVTKGLQLAQLRDVVTAERAAEILKI